MFDFFRDVYAELNGLDPDKIREEKSLLKKRFALSRVVKLTIRTVGIFYLIIVAINIIALFANGISLTIFKYIAAVIIDVIVLVFTFNKSKYSEMIIIIGVVLFIGINFFVKGI